MAPQDVWNKTNNKIKIHTVANDKVITYVHFITECYMYQHSTKQCHQHPTQRLSDKVGGTLELGQLYQNVTHLNCIN